MKVQAGDVIRVIAEARGQEQRVGKILRVEGPAGRERLYVRWEDDHESLLQRGERVEILYHTDPSSDAHPIWRTEGWGPLWD